MKKIILILFVLVSLVQIAVPLNMIWSKEKVIKNGTTYRFKTAPIDPEDPFRGKYLTLSFDISREAFFSTDSFTDAEEVYVLLKESDKGFAVIKNVSKTQPGPIAGYVKATVRNCYKQDGKYKLWIDFPFDRFYVEEYKAHSAEKAYNQAAKDTNQVAYALVHCLNGESVVTDVIINNRSIHDIMKEER